MLQADQQLAIVGPDVPAAQDVRVPGGDDVGVAEGRAQGQHSPVPGLSQVAVRDEIPVRIEPRPGRAVDARVTGLFAVVVATDSLATYLP